MTIIGVLKGAGRLSQVELDWAVFDSVRRTLAEDVHAALRASGTAGSLVLQECNGTIYTYYVNANHQLVRVQAGGGTSVIATDVRAWMVSVRSAPIGWLLTVICQTMDGRKLSWDVGNAG
ncbi:hypothetical protein [Alicyclobacillus vulcanalis]|uniref:hypothetical protein n=1 Tax=Alicyclobacillus vulcanalis TaxID=252246 RepID=UPI00117896DC|nr:hypothetical protein [Alicyclobacillus vulcanalis]